MMWINEVWIRVLCWQHRFADVYETLILILLAEAERRIYNCQREKCQFVYRYKIRERDAAGYFGPQSIFSPTS